MKKIIMIILLLFSCISPVYAENIENSNSLTINLAEQGRIEKVFDDGSSIIIEDVIVNTRAGLTVTGKKITGKKYSGLVQFSYYIDTKAYMANDDPENPIYYTEIKKVYNEATTVVGGSFSQRRFMEYNMKETNFYKAHVALTAQINGVFKGVSIVDKGFWLHTYIKNGYLTVEMEES
ncbi:MAG: hypothetical protein IJO27_02875 [Bacilli bacterium]|nr:hypothetical protein [Bacilli bacterium]